MIEPRMTNPVMVLDGALPALLALSKVVNTAGVDEVLLELVHMRASQLNECSVCVDLAGTGLTKLGVPPEKIYAIAAWTESPHFTDPERAALAVTEQATRLSHGRSGLTDTAFDELAAHFDEQQLAAILLAIGLVNLWNRVNDTTHQVPGSW